MIKLDFTSDFISKVTSIYSECKEALNSFYLSILELKDSLEAITTENGTLTKCLGAFRYVVGDTIYNIYYAIMLLGAGYTLFVLLRALVRVVEHMIFKKIIASGLVRL